MLIPTLESDDQVPSHEMIWKPFDSSEEPSPCASVSVAADEDGIMLSQPSKQTQSLRAVDIVRGMPRVYQFGVLSAKTTEFKRRSG